MNGIVKCLSILGTKVAGNNNTGTQGKTVAEADQQKNQTTGRADSGKCCITQKMAHSPCIKSIIEQLQQIAQQNRKRKNKHGFPDGTLCQGIAHGGSPSERDYIKMVIHPGRTNVKL
jgi:hypothetical protein